MEEAIEAVSNFRFFLFSGFFVPFIFLPDHAEGLGYSKEEGTMLLSVLGITNTIGRVMAGWLSGNMPTDIGKPN